MTRRGSLRLRLLALFAAYGMATLGVAGAALWLAARGGTDAVVQGVMVAGFGLAGLATGLWYLFDQHLARPIEMLAGSLRTGRPPDLSKPPHLADLGPAAHDAAAALDMYEVDGRGLDRLDRSVLTALCTTFGGGPVGLSTLATAVGEEAETVETVAEPFLIREGMVARTPRGRVALPGAWEHLGLAVPEATPGP